jgi:hypothetical protein
MLDAAAADDDDGPASRPTSRPSLPGASCVASCLQLPPTRLTLRPSRRRPPTPPPGCVRMPTAHLAASLTAARALFRSTRTRKQHEPFLTQCAAAVLSSSSTTAVRRRRQPLQERLYDKLAADNLSSALAARAAVLAFGDELMDLKLPDDPDSRWISQDGGEMAAAGLTTCHPLSPPRAAVLAFGDELMDLKLPDDPDSRWISQDGGEMAAAARRSCSGWPTPSRELVKARAQPRAARACCDGPRA